MPTSPGHLSSLLERHRILVCLGSGGVGKTTTAAAIALEAAMAGKRVLCLTVDPARRLATSLGMTGIRGRAQPVSPEHFQRQGLECKGELWAMMLDPKTTFDTLVTRHASSAASQERILANPFYRYISTSLSGTQEYMAMEQLYMLREDPRWDLLVLDTPPTANALDFLEAPQRLVQAVDSPAIRWLLQWVEGQGRTFDLLGRGANLLLKGIARFTGGAFLMQVADFVAGMNELFGGFRQRAERVGAILRSDEVAFCLVSSPSPQSTGEALFLSRRLAQMGMRSSALVVNGVHPLAEGAPRNRSELQELSSRLPAPLQHSESLDRLQGVYEEEFSRARGESKGLRELRTQLPSSLVYAEVPAFAHDVHDLASLHRVGRALIVPA